MFDPQDEVRHTENDGKDVNISSPLGNIPSVFIWDFMTSEIIRQPPLVYEWYIDIFLAGISPLKETTSSPSVEKDRSVENSSRQNDSSESKTSIGK